MANELSISAGLSARKGNLVESRNYTGNADLNAASPAKSSGIVSVGFAAHQALAMGSITTAGWSLFKNLDPTNFVQIGTDNSGAFIPFLKLKPGEFQLVRLATNAPYAKAAVAACKLSYEIYDD